MDSKRDRWDFRNLDGSLGAVNRVYSLARQINQDLLKNLDVVKSPQQLLLDSQLDQNLTIADQESLFRMSDRSKVTGSIMNLYYLDKKISLTELFIGLSQADQCLDQDPS